MSSHGSFLLRWIIVTVLGFVTIIGTAWCLHRFLNIGRPWRARFTNLLGTSILRMMKTIGLVLFMSGVICGYGLIGYGWWTIALGLGLITLGIVLYVSSDLELKSRDDP